MKASDTSTFTGALVSDENAKRYRNQATGIGQTRSASEATGARRSQCVIDCAPPAQLKVADRSYPAPGPRMVDGVMCNPVTGKKLTGAALYGPNPLVW
jgi:hypothetical protein